MSAPPNFPDPSGPRGPSPPGPSLSSLALGARSFAAISSPKGPPTTGERISVAPNPLAKLDPVLRPDGKFGVQIILTIDGVPNTFWLSGDTLKDANGQEVDVFRTSPAVRLGLPIGQMITQLLKGVGLNKALPGVVQSTKVNRLELRQTKPAKITASGGDPKQKTDVSFGLEIELNYGDSGDSAMRLWMVLGKKDGQWTFEFKLYLGNPANPVEVNVTLDDEGNFLASFTQDAKNAKGFSLAEVGRLLSPEMERVMGVINVAPLMMAIGIHRGSSNYVLAFQLSGSIALSRMPFVGEQLPPGVDLCISDLGLVWCSTGLANNPTAQTVFTAGFAEIELINPKPKNGQDERKPLSTGGMFSAELTVPGQPKTSLYLPLQSPSQKSAQPTKSAQPGSSIPSTVPTTEEQPVGGQTAFSNSTAPPPDPAKWFKVGKTVGPLGLQRIGLQYVDQKVWFLFDASLNAKAVALTIDGLGAGLDPFKLLGGHFKPAFTLRGLGLTVKGPVEVGGAFLRNRITDPRGDYDQFAGVVLIKTEALTISGMGSYADPPWSDPSFFAYAFLDKTIGGPPFFFVTGLAVGIAVNCSFDLPPIDQVSQFPLVRLALGDSLPAILKPPTAPALPVKAPPQDDELSKLLQIQQAMRPYTQPKSGQVALAVGVRFTTFNLLNSFGLLVASFGKPFKLDLLLSSRLQVPATIPGQTAPPLPPVAQVGIDLRGTWVPEAGTLLIEGRIAEGSWFLDSNCRLSGGATFASWTKGPHSGDFVLTVGGYHPQFAVPAHYPQVPRLAINFNRGAIAIKAEAYFALTPTALMVGGLLQATYSQGNVGAWFNCEANFLMAWEPFSYKADLYVEIGASYRTALGTVRGAIGAQLKLWGPDLAGIATINLRVFKFDIAFGDQNGKDKPLAPIKAKDFRDRFLPSKNEDLISIGVVSGLIRTEQVGQDTIFVVNPAEFCIAIESVIPQADEGIGIGPMGKTTLGKGEILKYAIDDKESFRVDPIYKRVPAALWKLADKENQVRLPSLDDQNPVVDAAVGYTIKPKQAWKPPLGNSYKTRDLATQDTPWQGHKPDGAKIQVSWHGINSSPNTDTVTTLLKSMADHPPIDLLAALTGETLDEKTARSRISLTTDWLDDLQTLPEVVTLEVSP